MAVRVGKDTAFVSRQKEPFVKIKQGDREVVVAVKRLRRDIRAAERLARS